MTDNIIGIDRVTRCFLRKNMVNIHLVSMAVYEGKAKDGPSHSLVFVGATADDARNNAIEYLRSVHDEKFDYPIEQDITLDELTTYVNGLVHLPIFHVDEWYRNLAVNDLVTFTPEEQGDVA